MEKLNILFVDDEPRILRSLKAAYKFDFNVFLAGGAQQAREILTAEKSAIDVVITDERMGEENGSEFVRWLVEYAPETAAIMLTGVPDISNVMATLPHPIDVVAKPWSNEQLSDVIIQANINHKTKLKLIRTCIKTKVLVLSADQSLRENCNKMSSELGDAEYALFVEGEQELFERLSLIKDLKAVVINAGEDLDELAMLLKRIRGNYAHIKTVVMASPAAARLIASKHVDVIADELLVKPMSIVRFLPAMVKILNLKNQP